MRARGYAALAAVVALATVLRAVLVGAGPDLDTDSYGHALIGRLMLDRPTDVTVHWVWLPLWHAVTALVAAAGGGIGAIRVLNVALATLPPFVLAATLRAADNGAPADATRAAEDAVAPFVAGAVLAVLPLCVALGASGQTETLFQLLLLAACLAWERDRPAAAGASLAVAALLRYEAWIVAPVFALAWLSRRRRSARGALAWALPALAAGAWCLLAYAQTRVPLGFLRVNAEYVRQMHASAGVGGPPAGAGEVVRAAAWYPIVVPARELGWLGGLCALAGLPWFVRRAPFTHRACAVVLLLFFTVGHVRRTHLGHARHYVALAPFLATCVAAGACALGRKAANAWRGRAAPAGTGVVATAGALVVLAVLSGRTAQSVRALVALEAGAFASERRAAEIVRRRVGPRGVVFCDLTRVEVFSGLPRERFVRWNASDVRPYNLWLAAARRGTALLVAREARLDRELVASATTVFREGGLVVLDADAAQAPAALRSGRP